MKTIGFVVIALVASVAQADAPVTKGFWKILVKPNAKWVLYDNVEREKTKDRKKTTKLVVETYDVRKVGDGEVARLRWTMLYADGTKGEHSCSGCYTQVAVNKKGMYIVNDAENDAQIAKSLKDKPSRSDPPKAYRSTEKNHGRYLKVDGGLVCFGELDSPPDGMCPDTCFASMCVSPDKGIVSMAGTWAPSMGIFTQEGFEEKFDLP